MLGKTCWAIRKTVALAKHERDMIFMCSSFSHLNLNGKVGDGTSVEKSEQVEKLAQPTLLIKRISVSSTYCCCVNSRPCARALTLQKKIAPCHLASVLACFFFRASRGRDVPKRCDEVMGLNSAQATNQTNDVCDCWDTSNHASLPWTH